MSKLTDRLQVIADHDFRISHIAHTSDTARMAKARIEALETALCELMDAARLVNDAWDQPDAFMQFQHAEQQARALLGERR